MSAPTGRDRNHCTRPTLLDRSLIPFQFNDKIDNMMKITEQPITLSRKGAPARSRPSGQRHTRRERVTTRRPGSLLRDFRLRAAHLKMSRKRNPAVQPSPPKEAWGLTACGG